jgi:phytol kinase
MNPWVGIIGVMVTLIIVIHSLSRLQNSIIKDPEVIRKSLHVTMGLLTLSFPWVFADAWPVLTLSIVSSLFIALLKVSNMKQWQPVVCARGRDSIGEIIFPLAIGLTFLLANGDKMLYLIPITILTLADTASAIVGQRFGTRKFKCEGDSKKSLQGSFAFSAVAFAATFIPLNSFTTIGTEAALSIATILGIVAMMFEAIAWKGLDNLFIPLGALIVLKTHVNLGLGELNMRLSLLVLVSMMIVLARRNSTLNGSGVIGCALFCYFAYILNGIEWVIMPVLLYLSYRLLLPARFRQIKSEHNVYAVISVASVGIIWLLISMASRSERFIFPYMLTFAAHAAIIATAHMRFTSFSRPKIFAILYAVLKAWCLIAVPLFFLLPSSQNIALSIILAPFCIGIPTVLFYAANSTTIKPFTRPSRWWKQASFAAIASLLGLIPVLIH